MNFDSLTSIFGGVPTDWIFLGVFALLVAFDTMRGGSSRVVKLAFALPLAALAFAVLDSAVVIGPIVSGLGASYAEAVLFLALVVLLYFIIGRLGIQYGGGGGQPVHAAVAGVALGAILVAIWMQIPALNTVWDFGSQIKSIFAESYLFWWFIASYIALTFVRRS